MASPGGSGRGKKGHAVIDGERPSCPECDGFMKSNGKRDWKCTNSQCGIFVVKNPVYGRGRFNRVEFHGYPRREALQRAADISQAERIIVTSAQNNTDVCQAFLKSLENCAEHYGAKLAVIPVSYKTKTLFEQDEEKHWKPELFKYLVAGDVEIGNVTIRADVKINATTLNPLTGKHGHCGERWVVFGHPQHQMEVAISPASQLPKRMYTTGSVTRENYTVTDAGEKAKFHHIQGALMIENFGDYCFIRTLHADKLGNFYDLDCRFTPKGVETGHSIEAIITGDEHAKFNAVIEPTYLAEDSIVNTLKPKFIVRHDVLDGYAGSHHHERDPMIQFKKHHFGDNDYRAELDQCVNFINQTTPEWAVNLIVPSNHHDHLKQWLNKADHNKDHTNAQLICELNLAMRKAALAGKDYDPFKLYTKGKICKKTKFLDRNEPYFIKDIDVSQHGDVGGNGSKGTIRGLAKSSHKMIIGHSHSARIYQGVFQVGTSTGRLEYERGLSSHTNTHCIIYKNGKRALIDIINGDWKL